MAEKKHGGKIRLTKLDLDEISLVASGDDPFALVVLSKAEPEGEENEEVTLAGLDEKSFKYTKLMPKSGRFIQPHQRRSGQVKVKGYFR